MGLLDGKVAFVTGAARGQGRSHAVRLAQEGCDIIAIDACATQQWLTYPLATRDDLAGTVKEVEALDRRIVAAVADVRDLAAVQAAVSSGVAALGGRLDIVCANAAIISWPKSTWEMDVEQWRELIDVNLTGVFITLKAAIPHMIAAGNGGSIALTSSGAALISGPGLADYKAAKAGVLSLVKTLACELAPHFIRVNAICPTASTYPAPSWPPIIGAANGTSPVRWCSSEWHSPAAATRTSTSPERGGSSSMSSTFHSVRASQRIAACVRIPAS